MPFSDPSTVVSLLNLGFQGSYCSVWVEIGRYICSLMDGFRCFIDVYRLIAPLISLVTF